MEEEELRIEKFRFDFKRSPFPAILLQAKRNAGKTYTAASMAVQFKHIHRWIAICGTTGSMEFWSKRFDSSATVRKADEEGLRFLEETYRRQEERIQEFISFQHVDVPDEFNLGIILDDCSSIDIFKKAKIVPEIFSNAKNANCVTIIMSQFPTQLWPAVRNNNDYVALPNNTKAALKFIHKEWIGEPRKFDQFLKIFYTVTGQTDRKGKKRFNSLVCQNVTGTCKLSELFAVFTPLTKAEVDVLLLGSEEWRSFNKKNYIDPYMEKMKQKQKARQKQERLQYYMKLRDGFNVDEYNDFPGGQDDDEDESDSEEETGAYRNYDVGSAKDPLKRIYLPK